MLVAPPRIVLPISGSQEWNTILGFQSLILYNLLADYPDMTIMAMFFILICCRAESLNNQLKANGWPSAYINGSQDQANRLTALAELKNFHCRILISTDLVRYF